jgi:hypothetical protein
VARFARVIALDTPHHVTQCGNARQFILTTDPERLVYLDLLGPSVVQRRCSLRDGAARHIAGYATLGAILDNRGLVELSRGGNLASRGQGHSREHPYRTAARHAGIYPKAGTRLRPPPRCSETRSPAQSCQQLTAINSQFLGETSRLSPVSRDADGPRFRR